MLNKKRGLGMGLNELLGDLKSPSIPVTQNIKNDPAPKQNELRKLPVDLLSPGRYQPRQNFASEALHELAQSIKTQGIIQPIVVRKIASGNYEIIAGERRWRAAQLAGLDQVPVIIRELSDENAIAIALIENIQRQDLNAIEEAIAMQRLIDEFQMTHEAVADAVGKSRSNVTNLLRLLKLNPNVRALVEKGELEMGHARALLALENEMQTKMAHEIINKNLTVRETEKLVQQLLNRHVKKPSHEKAIDPNIKHLQNKLSENLAAVVVLEHQTKGCGKLIIHYNSVDQLDGIIEKII